MAETRGQNRRVRVVSRLDAKNARLTPRHGTKLWFGPRGWGGWGWEPVSWEGWATTIVAIVLIVVPIWRAGHQGREGLWILPWSLGVTVVLIAVCLAKGTSPGGPRLRKEFDRTRRKESSGDPRPE